MAIKLRYLNTQRERMSAMVRSYWAELDQAHEIGKPVVYCLGSAPQEVFRTLDCTVFYGENFGSASAVARVSQELCEVAEAHGFPMELCSYIRAHIGAMITGKNPMGKSLPKPDLVAYPNTRCTSYAGWGKVIKHFFPDIPVLALDVPPQRDGMTREEYQQAVDYLKKRVQEIIDFATSWRGMKFDYDLFGEMVDNTGRGARAFIDLQETLRAKPAPLSLIDIFIQLFPQVCLRGKPEVADYYTAAKAEVDQRIADGFSAVPEEKFRVYWDGIAIWTRLNNQFQQLAKHGAALVSSVYTHSMPNAVSGYDGSRPLDSIAEGVLRIFANRGLSEKIDYASRLVKDFSADGIIMQVSRSCKTWFLDEYAVMKGVSERTGVPYCVVHGDMADPRLYSEKDIEDTIEAFLTELGKGK